MMFSGSGRGRGRWRRRAPTHRFGPDERWTYIMTAIHGGFFGALLSVFIGVSGKWTNPPGRSCGV
jgi:hypothetical protein